MMVTGATPEATPAGEAASRDVMLTIRDLWVNYGHVQAVKGLSLVVRRGEIVTLLGANGAGKTTVLRAISGLVRPRAGVLELSGENGGASYDLTRLAAHRIAEIGVGHAPEGRRVFGTLTVEENLNLGAYTRRRDRAVVEKRRERVYRLFPRLLERRGQLAGTLSGGEQQMLAIGRSLMGEPKLLLLDEPSLGLAPLLVREIFRTIREINAQGVTILLVEQNARLALQIAHRGSVLETGRLVLQGTARELAADERVRGAYLGEKRPGTQTEV